jgi:osmotically-inducible protein OsmY
MTPRGLLPIIVVVSAACGADTATQQQEQAPSRAQMEAPRASPAPTTAAVVPQNPGDRTIRRELNLAIDSDSDLTDRDISFIVSNGDVSVTGIVQSEAERERINHLAMRIPGVKSVANALRISE